MSAPSGYDGFLSRWSKRKSKAREPNQDAQQADNTNTETSTATNTEADTALAPRTPDLTLDSALQPANTKVGDVQTDGELQPGDIDQGLVPSDAQALAETTEVPLPDIETLTPESDFSPFMAPNVSAEIRNLALRKLFKAAIFNVRDGLDDYDDDFTSFEPLGNTITADMRHHTERHEKLAREALQSKQEVTQTAHQSDGQDSDAVVQQAEMAADDPANQLATTEDSDVDELDPHSATDQTASAAPAAPVANDDSHTETNQPANPLLSGKLRRKPDAA